MAGCRNSLALSKTKIAASAQGTQKMKRFAG
jgi:hypothetical protein